TMAAVSVMTSRCLIVASSYRFRLYRLGGEHTLGGYLKETGLGALDGPIAAGCAVSAGVLCGTAIGAGLVPAVAGGAMSVYDYATNGDRGRLDEVPLLRGGDPGFAALATPLLDPRATHATEGAGSLALCAAMDE